MEIELYKNVENVYNFFVRIDSIDGRVYMKNCVREGNYEKLGVRQLEGSVIFTFCREKEDQCAVVLIHRGSGEKIRIEVPEDFCIGSLCSIEVCGIEVMNYVYYFEINGEKVMDPYARRIMGREVWNDSNRKKDGYEVYAGFADEAFDWKRDRAPELMGSGMFIYKLHVRGFTMETGVRHPGTFRALMNKLGYLRRLGVTTVELMPVYEFEEMPIAEPAHIPEYVTWKPKNQDIIRPAAAVPEKRQLNYWGYGPGNYFAVKASYSADPEHASAEYKALVRRLHELGMECVMEMYFPEDSNHNMILDALRYWVREYHVDGFHLLGGSIPLTAIVQDNLLSRTKIFCEQFSPEMKDVRRCKNLFLYKDEYMYPARKILNHLNGNMKDFVDQQRKQGKNLGYVNYLACNNGFTLADLFMYSDKHNEANGEDNRDGIDWNFSNNYGCEGPTRLRYINSLRRRKWRNGVMMLFLAQGVPLLWSGDEFGNSQQGNNNAYCQDNPVGWVNWKNEASHRKELQFIKKLAEFRRLHPVLAGEEPFRFSDYRLLGAPDLSFHGENAWIAEPDAGRLCIGMLYSGAYSPDASKSEDVYVAYNFLAAESRLALPKAEPDKDWYLVMDSDSGTPYYEEQILQEGNVIRLSPQSVRVYVCRPAQHTEKRHRRKK